MQKEYHFIKWYSNYNESKQVNISCLGLDHKKRCIIVGFNLYLIPEKVKIDGLFLVR